MSDQPTLVVEGELRDGFTAIPNRVLHDQKLSNNAKMLYCTLLSFAWGKDKVWPGQERLAEFMRVTSRSIRNWLTELEAAGMVTITQRGLNKTNVYTLHLVPDRSGTVIPVRSGTGVPTKNTKREEDEGKKNPLRSSPEWNAVFDTLVRKCYQGKVTQPAFVAQQTDRAVSAGYTAKEVEAHYDRMRRAWRKDIPITPRSVIDHWDTWTEEVVGGNGAGRRGANDYAPEDFDR